MMNIKKAAFFVVLCCGMVTGCDRELSVSEKQATVLKAMASNLTMSISDYAVHRRVVTNDILLVTLLPLNESQRAEYEKNGYLVNQEHDIDNAVTYTVTGYQLINENSQPVDIRQANQPYLFQKTGLYEKGGQWHQVLISPRKLSDTFSELTGYIEVRLIIPGVEEEVVNLPIDIAFSVR